MNEHIIFTAHLQKVMQNIIEVLIDDILFSFTNWHNYYVKNQSKFILKEFWQFNSNSINLFIGLYFNFFLNATQTRE